MDRLAVLLGGRAAEQIVFGKLSTGASNDLERATDLARRMVCEFGMSSAVGMTSFPRRDGPDRSSDRDSAMSEQVTARIESEIDLRLSRAFDRACQDLTTHRAVLESVASALLDRGSLDREELLALMSS